MSAVIHVTPEAVSCFTRDWGLREGDTIRLYARYSSGSKEAFTLGVSKESPKDPAITTVAGGITFFIEDQDVWYLDDRPLTIDCVNEEIVFIRTQ